MVKIFFSMLIISVLFLSGCDIYNTLYVKQPIEGLTTVPEGRMISDAVFRVEDDQAAENLEKTVYAAAAPVEHDPFKIGENPLGPFEKGASLGFTLEEWLAARGKGTYEVDGDTAKISLELQSLVPNGVYTVWCSRIKMPPDPEIVDKPCGAADGSESLFTADGDGKAVYEVELGPLELSTEEDVSVIALAYHSDGQTYEAEPGDFGYTTHVQLFYMIPELKADDDEYEFGVELVDHIEAGLPEQDVFIEMEEVKEVPIEVEPSGEAIVIIVEETDLVSLIPQAEDPDNDNLIFTFTSPLDEEGEWQTSYGDHGEYTVTVTASDGTLTATEEVLIIVTKKEEAPVFESISPEDTVLNIKETDSMRFEVEATDLNNDNLAYTWKLDGVEVSGQPLFNYESTFDDAGSHTVKVTVTDGVFETEKIWSVTVDNVNRKPALSTIDSITVKETETVVIPVEATDPDGDEITFGIDDDRFDQEGGVFSWDTTYEDSGEHKVTVSATDGVDVATQEVTVTVENVNRPPRIIDITQK